jgi:hypothetical protein
VPYTEKQRKAINAVKHGWSPPEGAPFHGVSKQKAAEMMTEGVRRKKKLTAREAGDALAKMHRG